MMLVRGLEKHMGRTPIPDQEILEALEWAQGLISGILYPPAEDPNGDRYKEIGFAIESDVSNLADDVVVEGLVSLENG